jgi:hypothetical protein
MSAGLTAGLPGLQAQGGLANKRLCSHVNAAKTKRVVFTSRVQAQRCTPGRRAGRSVVVKAAAAASVASVNGSKLPWQAAMDDIKKRKDIKSIMIIGAGPIVIGQVLQRLSYIVLCGATT